MPEPHTVTQMASRSQREAITHTFGPCLVIAGPGSGKTFVLVEHIVFLIESLHIPPSKILVLTFSRAAAGQMRDRFLRRISADTTSVTFGTFHSVFYHILRETTGRPWPVIGEEERRRFAAMLTRNLWPEKALRPLPDQLLSDISRYKSCGGRDFTPSAAVGDPRLFSRALRSYGAFLKESSCIDLDDMITECRRLLQRDRDARGRWMARFPFLLVDEYQDINRDQYALLRLLAGDRANLFAVGDDDQSIYGFRGSDPRIMTGFVRDFPGCRRVFLETNYRCGRPIVQKAALVIGENRERIPKKIRAASPAGDPVVLRGWADEREEFTRLADAGYRRADAVCGVSESYCGRALRVNRKCEKGTAVYLGAEPDAFAADHEPAGPGPGPGAFRRRQDREPAAAPDGPGWKPGGGRPRGAAGPAAFSGQGSPRGFHGPALPRRRLWERGSGGIFCRRGRQGRGSPFGND